ncbi:MAG TPA: PIN domain-containing protein, partial [Candidatus Nanoarchaeia archaeon]|nr:PIN domain-containing protein [Candidatus Nanoarchaeia archaeon]
MNYVPDTSVIIEEILSKEILEGTLSGTILIHNAVVAELEHQANTGQEIGLIGLKEIKTLRELSEQGKITLEFIGERPSAEQIKYAKKGEIDALIRKNTYDNNATLITADLVQARSAE